MMEPYQIVLITVGVIAAIELLAMIALSGLDIRRLGLACRFSWRALRGKRFAEFFEPLLYPPGPKPVQPSKLSGAPLRLLALLQREGRIVDFLLEDIHEY